MSTKTQINTVVTPADTLDTFFALTNIYLTSSERLSELSLAAARKTVEDCVSATKAAAETTSGRELGAIQSVFGKPAFERALAYSRASFEILVGAQQEAAQLLAPSFSLSGMRFPVSEDWRAASNMFTKGVRDLSAMTTANITAATDAGSKMAARAESAAKNAA